MLKSTDAIILAGGLGTRLQPISGGKPKPLMPVGDEEFLEFVLRWLKRNGVQRVILSLHYKADHYKRYILSKSFGLEILTVVEPQLLGTGGAVKLIKNTVKLSDDFFVVNGDTYLDFDLEPMYAQYQKASSDAMIGLSYVDDASRYGRVEFEGEKAKRFLEKSGTGPGWINNGCYILRGTSFIYEEDIFSLERDFFPALISRGSLDVFQTDGAFIDIGIPSDYEKFTKIMTEHDLI